MSQPTHAATRSGSNLPGPAGPGQVFLVAAPSGAGKSSLVNALLEQDPSIRLSVSFTTRAPRPGEVDGREYHFVSAEEFAQRRSRGEFLETAEVHGNWYGTSRRWIEQELSQGADVLLEIDWQGARQIKQLFAQAVGVFILPPSLEALRARLEQRGQDPPAVIARRLAAARSEIEHVSEFDFVIINEHFERALAELAAVVTAARRRYASQAARAADVFERLGIGRARPGQPPGTPVK
ncbi:MAG TPA: guanylate kinase [Burkholderiaceae bacterium]|nr:guanylate kinase [Burkholderiaceae bacterium]